MLTVYISIRNIDSGIESIGVLPDYIRQDRPVPTATSRMLSSS
jgi:hypothetical protein